MSRELIVEGRILTILPLVTGEGRNGTWEKQEVILELPSRFPTRLLVEMWGDRRSILEPFKEGDAVNVWVELSSREYNGRWYTSVRAWRIQAAEGVDPAAATPVQESSKPRGPQVIAADAARVETSGFDFDAQEDSDLPF